MDGQSADSAAARYIVSRTEIAKYGDVRLADLLTRVPGITIEVSSSGKATVRLRGLGTGYTQILLNGQPTPPDFTIDSIAPSLIERIEVLRTGSVDMGASGIAGTINIVLRAASAKTREWRTTVAEERGLVSAQLDNQYSERSETAPLTYSLGLSLGTSKTQQPTYYRQTAIDSSGVTLTDRSIQEQTKRTTESLSVTPGLSWTPSNGESLRLENFVQVQRYRGKGQDERTTLSGIPPELASDAVDARTRSTFIRSRLNWTRTLDKGEKVQAKFGVSRLRRDASSVLDGFDANDDAILQRFVTSTATDDSVLLAGSYRAAYAEAHAFALGWDAEYSRRKENRVQREETFPSRPPQNLDESYDAGVRRLAMFVQDEWDPTSEVSLYLGLRWEGLQTRSTTGLVASVGNSSSVVSPVFQLLWKPANSEDQVRLGVSRTYKAPRTIDLIARRWVMPDNTPTTPNPQGNPNLRPEVAWGVDLAYEHRSGKTNVVAMSTFARRVDDVVLKETSFVDGAWIIQPQNMGRADIIGAELETKLNLGMVLDALAPVDLRFNALKAASTVKAVPGRNNRLDRQVPFSANIGFDYRTPGHPIALGGSFGLVGGGWARTAQTYEVNLPSDRKLDAYTLWKLSNIVQVRLSFTRKWRSDGGRTQDVYSDETGTFQQLTFDAPIKTFRLGIEIKL